MDGYDLLPATREEISIGLAYPLRYDKRGKAHRLARDTMGRCGRHVTGSSS